MTNRPDRHEIAHAHRRYRDRSAMKTAALIVAAGRGERAGGLQPKQYHPVAGKPLLLHTASALEASHDFASIVIVVPSGDQALVRDMLAPIPDCQTVDGGDSRQASVLAGLEALTNAMPEFVLIHDAARPCVPATMIARLVESLSRGGGVMPGVPVTDTLRQVDRSLCGETVPRDGLWQVQTPQGFCYPSILAAHRSAGSGHTDDVSIAAAAGMQIVAVPGDPDNIKVTTPDDFSRVEQIMSRTTADIRTGQGFDVHRFEEGDHVWLCGVRIDHDRGLAGHSDADVGLHALTDALLGAIGAGDIGLHFSPFDPRWKDTASDRFLAHAAGRVDQAGGVITHVDVTLISEAPKVGPHREAMVNRIAEILAIDPVRVSVKATTTEKLGFTGRGEGIAAQAMATVRMEPVPC